MQHFILNEMTLKNTTFSEMSKRYQELSNHLKSERPKIFDFLGKGGSKEIIRNALPGINIPAIMILIYTNICVTEVKLKYTNPSTEIIPGYNFIPLKRIKLYMQDLINLKNRYKKDYAWNENLIPILRNESSDYYCVDINSQNEAIYSLDHFGECSLECKSSLEFINKIIKSYACKAYFIGNKGFLECNWDLEEDIWQDHE